MKNDCGCCEGFQPLTPQTTVNRPGLTALTYRVGTHDSFLQTMLARLSSSELPALARLKTRQSDDFAIALLDAWATVADVLTFYQERIANEGYLRTATERRSILELARLVGYQLRPGVAATVHLAFTMEKEFNDDSVFIPAGTQAQSIPQPGELPQIFETEKDETARTDWNKLQPRLTRPHYITSSNAQRIETIYAQGIDTSLEVNDRLLFVFENNSSPVSRIVGEVERQTTDDRTKIVLLDPDGLSARISSTERASSEVRPLSYPLAAISENQLRGLVKTPTVPPASALRLNRDTALAFNPATDIAPNLLTTLQPALKNSLYQAFRNTSVTPTSALDGVERFGVKAAPFGHNAPPKIVYDDDGRPVGSEEWGLNTLMVSVEWLLDSTTGVSNVVIQDQGKTYRGQISLSANLIVLNQITIELEDSSESASRLFSYRFTEQGQDTPFKTITITFTTSVPGPEIFSATVSAAASAAFPLNLPEGAPTTVGVAINDNRATNISFGQQQQFTIGQRTVFLSYQNPAVLVQDTEETAVRVSQRHRLSLDAQYDKILPGSWVLIERPGETQTFRVEQVQTVSIVRYGLTGKVTQLMLDAAWLTDTDRQLSDIRDVTVYAQSEALTLAEDVIDPVKNPVGGETIELADLYGGLQAGRWLIVCGERTDIPDTSGVQACELVMLAAVRQGVATISPEALSPDDSLGLDRSLPGDTTHSFLSLATPLKYTYKRDTATVYGNVVKATHGETREEVLGSGDGSQTFQSFTLRQPPLTFVSAPTPAGIQSTLEVRVNQVQWHEIDSLGRLGRCDRNFITRNDNDANTIITFGDGQRGVRPPTGIENIRAKYRSGIGKAGNVSARQISLLASRPLGVKEVINPLAASGGADPDNRDQARLNAPLGVKALDRLVSLQDYEDFARTFAGIGKASAVQLSDGFRDIILLTIAGEDDIPITPTSDLYRNLKQALQTFGSPSRWVQINLRDLMVLIVAANVRLLPDYHWEAVGPTIRTTLLDTFSFQRRALGQDIYSSEILAAIHRVAGVDYVDLDVFGSIAESEVIVEPANDAQQQSWLDKLEAIAQANNQTPPPPRLEVQLGRVSPSDRSTLLSAQLAIVSPDVPDTLKLEELTL